MRARDNPFRSDRVLAVRYRLQGGSWEDLLARFDALGRRAAIVGPKGSGKTTLLEDLAPRFRERGFSIRELRLSQETPRFEQGVLEDLFASLTARDLILFDGAEQLSWLAWSRFERRSRAAGGLLVTVHQPGRLPTLLETQTDARLLACLIDQILEDRADEARALAPQLFERHGGNLREALRDLYDRYSDVNA